MWKYLGALLFCLSLGACQKSEPAETASVFDNGVVVEQEIIPQGEIVGVTTIPEVADEKEVEPPPQSPLTFKKETSSDGLAEMTTAYRDGRIVYREYRDTYTGCRARQMDGEEMYKVVEKYFYLEGIKNRCRVEDLMDGINLHALGEW